MPNKSPAVFDPSQFTPEFRAEFDKTPLDVDIIWCSCVLGEGTPGEDDFKPLEGNRNFLIISDGKDKLEWTAPPLCSLFRGDKKPPVFGAYPDETYDIAFAIVESHVLEICGAFGDRTDLELKEIYAAMRKRPDGKSMGFVHDHVWRGAALLLATHRLSQAEYEAIMSRLEKSCRTFETGPSSRNYVHAVRQTLQEGSYE
jgi:hypothetical protein